MFVGHALLAFALVTGVAAVRGWSRERALQYAALAAAFAAAPDVDMAYAPIGLALSDAGSALGLAQSFWAAGNLVHRSITHSLVMSVPVAAAAALWVRARAGDRSAPTAASDDRSAFGGSASSGRGGGRQSPAATLALATAVALLAAAVAVATAVSGALGGAVTVAFGLTCLCVAELAARRTRVGPRAVFALAFVGLASHPFGDLFTGEPPAFLYPLGTTLMSERITLHSDPTLNLLGAFGIELVTIWLGFTAVLWLAGVRPVVPLRASIGTGYAATVLLIPEPTLEFSYPFVFSVLAVGAIGVLPRIRFSDPDGSRIELPGRVHAITTALTAVTLAWVAYAAAYLALG